jgi:hypothetical protein
MCGAFVHPALLFVELEYVGVPVKILERRSHRRPEHVESPKASKKRVFAFVYRSLLLVSTLQISHAMTQTGKSRSPSRGMSAAWYKTLLLYKPHHAFTNQTYLLFIHSVKENNMASFENKVVIITGCSSGIGLATTRLFLERQATVFGIDISAFKEELTTAHREAFTFHEVDLTIPKAADDAVAACVIKHGKKIDVLINCAGISDGWSSADTVKDSEWERVLAINLTVPVRLMTAVLPSMKEHKKGAIVNVASRAAVSGASSGIAYTASKHGLVCCCLSWINSTQLTP